MEKPAVIFNEAGFKMFLDFIGNMQRQSPEAPEHKDNPVDALVSEYFKRTDRPDLTGKVEEVEDEPVADARYNMDDVARVVSDYLYHHPGDEVTSDDIIDMLAGHGFHYQLRSIAPVMRGVMNRYPEIKRVDVGVYEWGGPVANE